MIKCEWRGNKVCEDESEFIVGHESDLRRFDLHLCLHHLHAYVDGLLHKDCEALPA